MLYIWISLAMMLLFLNLTVLAVYFKKQPRMLRKFYEKILNIESDQSYYTNKWRDEYLAKALYHCSYIFCMLAFLFGLFAFIYNEFLKK
jgi:hypothetical protein